MKNIIRIFRRDLHRLGTNALALVIIAGVTLLPALYAYERHLIDDEERVLVLVRSERKLSVTVSADRFLTIDVLVYGGRRTP